MSLLVLENVGENSQAIVKQARIRMTHIIEIFIVRQSSIIIRWRIIDSDNFVLSLPLAPAWWVLPRGNWSDSPILRGLLAPPARIYVWFQSSRIRLGFLRVKATWVNSLRLGLATFLACEIIAKIRALVVVRKIRWECPRNEHSDAINSNEDIIIRVPVDRTSSGESPNDWISSSCSWEKVQPGLILFFLLLSPGNWGIWKIVVCKKEKAKNSNKIKNTITNQRQKYKGI